MDEPDILGHAEASKKRSSRKFIELPAHVKFGSHLERASTTVQRGTIGKTLHLKPSFSLMTIVEREHDVHRLQSFSSYSSTPSVQHTPLKISNDDLNKNLSTNKVVKLYMNAIDDIRCCERSLEDENLEDGTSSTRRVGKPRQLILLEKEMAKEREKTLEDNVIQLNQELEALLEHLKEEVNHLRDITIDTNFVLNHHRLNRLCYESELYVPGNLLKRTVGRRIKDHDVRNLCRILQKSDKTIETLNLAYNDITDVGLAQLSEAVKNTHSLLNLNLMHNNFTAEGLKSLVFNLMERPALKSLDISGVKVGNEGIDLITSLVLSGKGPEDLNISECDLTVEGFQGLCSTWFALDHDIDIPVYLKERGKELALPLETLARMRQNYLSQNKEDMELYHTRSVLELIVNSAAHGRANEIRSATSKIYDDASLDSSASITKDTRESFSSSVIKELFEADCQVVEEPMRKEGESIFTDLLSESHINAVEKIQEEHQETGDKLDQQVMEHKLAPKRPGECSDKDSEGKPIIVCPSLYSLEVSGELSDMSDRRGNEATNDSALAHELTDEAKLVDTKNDINGLQDTPDLEQAKEAGEKFVKQTLKEAGREVASSGIDKGSDVIQKLLLSILQTCSKLMKSEQEGQKVELAQETLNAIWSDGMKEAEELLHPSMPESYSISPEIAKTFIETIFKRAHASFYSLLNNPFLHKLLIEEGIEGIIKMNLERKAEKQRLYEESLGNFYGATTSGKQALFIVAKFLQDVIMHAAEEIGCEDPFGGNEQIPFQSEKIRAAEEASLLAAEKVMLAAGIIAKDSDKTNQSNKITLGKNNNQTSEPAAAANFMHETFEDVEEMLTEMRNFDRKEMMAKTGEKSSALGKPIRIVINRPLFNGYEELMALKLGDYLRENSSVRIVHIRKWNLGEDGMASLMQGLSCNMNLVTLDLGCNGIGGEGATFLASYLKKTKTLKHLLMNNNRLRDPGMRYISESIPFCSLISLNVAYNDATDRSLDLLLERIRGSNLKSLYIFGNRFSESTWDSMFNLLEDEELDSELCDVILEEVDGVKSMCYNGQCRDTNEWYHVPPIMEGLQCPPYLSEGCFLAETNSPS